MKQLLSNARLPELIFFGLIALLWEMAAEWFGIRQYLLPSLSAVLFSLWDNAGELYRHTLITLNEVVVGYLWAVVGGLALGLVIHAMPLARRTVYPLIVLFQGLPKVALAPLMVIWFGYGLTSKVLMAFLFAFFPIVIGMLGGLESVPSHLREHFDAIGASRWIRFWRLQMPAAMPSIVDACKTAMPLAVIGAIIGEFVGAEGGLGYVILSANASARSDLLFAALVVISILSTLLYLVVELLGRRVWWRGI
ncbi:ABC transporter permease [Nitratireductor rhodophyticola]|uniref:ABC transporter permease n=1 Tax=Nitratireductor rhodophyticola TaxID=2854036 RepID=UPI00300B5EB8